MCNPSGFSFFFFFLEKETATLLKFTEEPLQLLWTRYLAQQHNKEIGSTRTIRIKVYKLILYM